MDAAVNCGRSDSDVDLAVRLDDHLSEGGFDHFAKIATLREELSSIPGTPVDVVEEPVRLPRLQAEIERDRIVAVSSIVGRGLAIFPKKLNPVESQGLATESHF